MSSRHWNVTPVSFDVNENVAVAAELGDVGRPVIVADGAVLSTVTVRDPLVAVLPPVSVTRAVSDAAPSASCVSRHVLRRLPESLDFVPQSRA